MKPITKIIFGLGNPGVKYKSNRHNIGYMVLDALAGQFKVSYKRKLRVTALLTKIEVDDKTVLLVKPAVFMNNSGTAVKKTLAAYGGKDTDFLVVYDDIDLPLGMIRLRSKGSCGGHRGVDSIINYLGKDKISRLRVGISEGAVQDDLADYVLSDFARNQIEEVEKVIKRACGACLDWVRFDSNFVMQKYNRKNKEE